MSSKIALTAGVVLLTVSGLAFDVSSVRLICEKPGNWRLEKRVLESKPGVTEIEVRLATASPETPPAFSVWCEVPQKDVPYVWRAAVKDCSVPPVWGGLFRSQLASQMPVYSYFHADGQNALTLATSEAKRDVGFRCGVVEEGSKLRITFTYFDFKAAPIAEYAVRVRFDARKVPYSDAVREASDWITATAKLTPADVPDAAFDPLYSTWYNFHQNLHADDIEAECAIAAKLGMKVLIVDDGWQTDDNGRGYASCGDWQVSTNRFPDMAAHVARVHKLGMRYMMWYSVPFVGYKSANYARFKGKYLKNDDRLGASVLDPRFPEVREFLIGIYEKAVRDWDLDGLKLDFIGSFKGGCEDARGGGRDIDTVPEATDVLMKAVYARLKALKPDILVEFRQGYIGPAIRQYGNMLRVGDCPGDYQMNRAGIARLRLTSGTTAVHADMLEWNVAETPQEAARYVLNCLFGTIQYSMMLRTLPAKHLEMIRHWLGFSLAHRSALLKGDFRPLHPELNYPVLEGSDAKERVIGVYAADQVVRVQSDGRTAYVVNATPEGELALDCAAPMTTVAFDTFGHETGRFKVAAGVSRVACPPSGYLLMTADMGVRKALPDLFKKGEKILFIGDSITHGGRKGDMNHYLGHGFAAEIAMRYLAYRPELDLQFANRGISGDSSSNVVARWSTDAIPFTPNEKGYDGPFPGLQDKPVVPDWMNILVGCNDDWKVKVVPFADYEKNLRFMLDSARKANPKMRIVICEEFRPLNPDGTERASENTLKRREVVRRLVKEYNLIYVPFNDFFQKTLMAEKPQMKWWIWDNVHPTYAGHMRMADFWLETVAKAVGGR